MATYTIVFSNYTSRLFAWLGTPAANRKFLGNRCVLASVEAGNADDALTAWLQRELKARKPNDGRTSAGLLDRELTPCA
jgi:hypothetical protein